MRKRIMGTGGRGRGDTTMKADVAVDWTPIRHFLQKIIKSHVCYLIRKSSWLVSEYPNAISAETREPLRS